MLRNALIVCTPTEEHQMKDIGVIIYWDNLVKHIGSCSMHGYMAVVLSHSAN